MSPRVTYSYSTFDQAVILILLNVVLDRLTYGKQPSPRPQNRSSAAMAENRRRPKLLHPIKGRPVGAGARIGYCAAPPNLIPERTEITESWARDISKARKH